jgi:hypothetical protein
MTDSVFVIDNGACRCRVGLAGDAQPRAVFQNAVAKGKGDSRLMLGSEIDETRYVNQLNIRRPFDRGYLINWGLESGIWSRMLDLSIPEVLTRVQSARFDQYARLQKGSIPDHGTRCQILGNLRALQPATRPGHFAVAQQYCNVYWVMSNNRRR